MSTVNTIGSRDHVVTSAITVGAAVAASGDLSSSTGYTGHNPEVTSKARESTSKLAKDNLRIVINTERSSPKTVLTTPGGSKSQSPSPDLRSARSASHGERTTPPSPDSPMYATRHPPFSSDEDRSARTLTRLAINSALDTLAPITSSITLANRRDTIVAAMIGTRIPAIIKDLENCRDTLEPKVKAALPDHLLEESGKQEFNSATFEKLVRDIPHVVEDSHQGIITPIQPLIKNLEFWLRGYLKEYKMTLRQHYADLESREKAINEVLRKYQFVSLRHFFWALTAISATHCKHEKETCLSLLIRCFENDPLNEDSSAGLYGILEGVINRLEGILNPRSASSPSSNTDEWAEPKIVAQYTRLLTITTEVWTQQYSRGQTMALYDILITRIRSILSAIEKINTNASTDVSREVQLSGLIASEAIKNLVSDKSRINKCVEVVGGIGEAIKELVSNKNFIPLVQGTWKVATAVFNAYGLLQKSWYVELFGIRKAVQELHEPSEKLELLQSCLVEHQKLIHSWEFVGGILHMLGKVALETSSHYLRYNALMGQQITKFTNNSGRPLQLPGLFHFRHPQMAQVATMMDRVGNKLRDSSPRMLHLHQITKNYAIKIIELLPEAATFSVSQTFQPIFKEAYCEAKLSKYQDETDEMRSYRETLGLHPPEMAIASTEIPQTQNAGAAATAAIGVALAYVEDNTKRSGQPETGNRVASALSIRREKKQAETKVNTSATGFFG